MGDGIRKPILCIKSSNFLRVGETYYFENSSSDKNYIFMEKDDKSALTHCDDWFLNQHFMVDPIQIRDYLIDLLIN